MGLCGCPRGLPKQRGPHCSCSRRAASRARRPTLTPGPRGRNQRSLRTKPPMAAPLAGGGRPRGSEKPCPGERKGPLLFIYLFIFFLKEFLYFYYLFIYLFYFCLCWVLVSVRGLSLCGKQGPLFIAVRGPLMGPLLTCWKRAPRNHSNPSPFPSPSLQGLWNQDPGLGGITCFQPGPAPVLGRGVGCDVREGPLQRRVSLGGRSISERRCVGLGFHGGSGGARPGNSLKTAMPMGP